VSEEDRELGTTGEGSQVPKEGQEAVSEQDALIKKYADLLTSQPPTSNASREEGLTSTSEEQEGREEVREEKEASSEKQAVAVLKVYGQQIPVYSMEDLIRYAQMGVDYAIKMNRLKQWSNEIKFIQEHPEVKELIQRGLRGEDVKRYINLSGEMRSSEEGLSRSEEERESSSSDVIDKVIEKTIQEKMAPYLHTFNTTMFIQNLRMQDPKYADIILRFMADLAVNPPSNFPVGLIQAIDRDPQTFLAVYNALRNKLIALEEANKKAQAQQKVTKLKSKQAPPTIEKPTAATTTFDDKMLEEAKSIWDLDDNQFKKLLGEIKLRGKT